MHKHPLLFLHKHPSYTHMNNPHNYNHFLNHLKTHGKDFSDYNEETFHSFYNLYLENKSQFVKNTGEESKIIEISKIIKNKNEFKAICFTEGRFKLERSLDLNMNDYKLPFLIKDYELRLRQQLFYINEMYKKMKEEGLIEEGFITDEIVDIVVGDALGERDTLGEREVAVERETVVEERETVVEERDKEGESEIVETLGEDVTGGEALDETETIAEDKEETSKKEESGEIKIEQMNFNDREKSKNEEDTVESTNDKNTISLNPSIISQYTADCQEVINPDINSTKRRNLSRIKINIKNEEKSEEKGEGNKSETIWDSISYYLSKSRF